MEKNRASRIVAIVALCFAIVGVSVGFAAWSATLVITGAQSSVSQGNEEALFDSLLTMGTPSCDPTGTAVVTSPGSVDSGKHTWTGASLQLKAPGDSVTCTSEVSNASAFIAYLKSIELSGRIACTNTNNGQSVSAACDSLKLTVNGSNGTKTDSATVLATTVTPKTGITGNGIAAKSGANDGKGSVSFTLEYLSSGTVSDADFSATLPEMTFNYSTLD